MVSKGVKWFLPKGTGDYRTRVSIIDYKRTKHDQFPSPLKDVCWDVGSPTYRAQLSSILVVPLWSKRHYQRPPLPPVFFFFAFFPSLLGIPFHAGWSMRLGGGWFVLMYVLACFSSFDLESKLIIYRF